MLNNFGCRCFHFMLEHHERLLAETRDVFEINDNMFHASSVANGPTKLKAM